MAFRADTTRTEIFTVCAHTNTEAVVQNEAETQENIYFTICITAGDGSSST